MVTKLSDLKQRLTEAGHLGSFDLMCGLSVGMFIVRRHEEEGNYHAIVVDLYHRLIVDGLEDQCIQLTAENLKKCGSKWKRGMRLFEIRQIVPSR